MASQSAPLVPTRMSAVRCPGDTTPGPSSTVAAAHSRGSRTAAASRHPPHRHPVRWPLPFPTGSPFPRTPRTSLRSAPPRRPGAPPSPAEGPRPSAAIVPRPPPAGGAPAGPSPSTGPCPRSTWRVPKWPSIPVARPSSTLLPRPCPSPLLPSPPTVSCASWGFRLGTAKRLSLARHPSADVPSEPNAGAAPRDRPVAGAGSRIVGIGYRPEALGLTRVRVNRRPAMKSTVQRRRGTLGKRPVGPGPSAAPDLTGSPAVTSAATDFPSTATPREPPPPARSSAGSPGCQRRSCASSSRSGLLLCAALRFLVSVCRVLLTARMCRPGRVHVCPSRRFRRGRARRRGPSAGRRSTPACRARRPLARR